MHRVLLFALLVAQEITPQCGGAPASTPAPASNVQAIVVNAGPANNYFNGAFTSVTICVPGQTTGCQTIDGVLVDTGSSGLRVLSSALTLSLPQQAGSNGGPIVECAQFLDGFTWGPVQTADVKLAGEQASRVPIQVIDERAFPNIPTSCSSSGTAEDTLDALGANAILGVGLFKQDCGLACAFVGSSNPGFYFSCPASGCQPAAVPLVSQVQNPVALFPTDNNGVVIQLPAVPAGGAVSVTGSLIYGIGTQSNNALGSAKVHHGRRHRQYHDRFWQPVVPSQFHRLGIQRHLLPRFGLNGSPAVSGQLGLLLSGLDAVSVHDKHRHERRVRPGVVQRGQRGHAQFPLFRVQ